MNKGNLVILFLFVCLFFVLKDVYAQTVVKGPPVTTTVGSPTGTSPGGGTTGSGATISPDGTHACPVIATYIPYPGSYSNIGDGQYSYVCGHSRPIYNAIDVGTVPTGGTKVVAVVDGTSEDITNPVGGPAIWLTGNDGRNYYYAHLRSASIVSGPVKVGQVIGEISAASEDAVAKNNKVAHVHISTGTPGNQQSFSDPANIPIGPILDEWCGIDVCHGQPNQPF